MPKNTVLICSPSYAVRGGVESIINDLTRELPSRGWDAVLGLAKGSHFNDVSRYREAHRDLPIVEIDGTRGTRQARVDALKTIIRRVKPDIVLSARIYDVFPAVSSLKSTGKSPRLAITIQGYESQYFYDAHLYRDNLDLCVAAGNMISKAAVEWCGLPEERVVSIPGVVRPPFCEPTPRRLGEQLHIGYVGRLDQSDKRVLDLVSLVRFLDQTDLRYLFRVVGDGTEREVMCESLKDQIAQGRLVFEGWKNHTQLYEEVYPNLDCFVNFSPAEGVSVGGGEAMAHGVVPVVSQCIGIKTEQQYVEGVNSLTFPVGDIATASGNILRLWDEPGLLTRLSSEAARRMRDGRYSFSSVIDSWADAFDRCLAQPPRTGALPSVSPAKDGRLASMGFPPAVAQHLRNFVGRRHNHADPGGEWPTGSGLLTEDAATEIMRFAAEYENSRC